jgi:Tfp pilus assembly protein PilO
MMPDLKLYRVPIALGAAALVAAVVILLAWVVPQGHTLSSLDSQKQALAAQEQQLQADIVALQHDQDQKVTNCGTLQPLLAEVPPTLDESQFVLDVGALAQAAGAPSIPSLTWGASTPGPGIDSVQVSLTLQGTFGQVMAFVHGLDGSGFPRLFTVSNFSIGAAGAGSGSSASASSPVVVGTSLQSPSAPGYQVSLSGQIYYSPTQHDVCASLQADAS